MPSCDPPAALQARAKECADNIVYARAAKACLERFDAAVLAAQKTVAESLKGLSAPGRQAAELENAKKTYDSALRTLRGLAARGKILEKQAQGYENEVFFPEDFGHTGMPASKFLAEQPCYSETQKLVKQYSRLLGLSAQQLEITAQISEELAKKALKGEGGLSGQDLQPLLGGKTPAPGIKGALPKPKDKGRESTITGTKEEK